MHSPCMEIHEHVCENCGKTYTRTTREHRKHHYCSRECRGPRAVPGPTQIPWLRPRNWQEQALGEMIAGAAIEFQHCLPGARNDNGPTRHVGIDYWNGYWAALIDYGRRVFEVRAYNGPGDDRDYEESTTTEDDGAPAVPEEAVSDV